ncbi:sarcoplasmic reticulum histidine-rich calcium-binding protein isoform X2 [Drosophila pseudoobscura]|uniref:Sarcoplasmic reticulum histidine-rich calcium-binding protein isoform X2 n=1 Tax=Drosophila pseudoobscura pseudoobscura TaxID=46245 RepID=A0A6I8VK42_DROPS|nr:sarcoplasmic reticulum histidine-rich calcium-binding protein isoform X2 [Drosophila pseudoobscura]
MKSIVIFLALFAACHAAPTTPANVKEATEALSRPSPIAPDVISDPKPVGKVVLLKSEPTLHRQKRDETAHPKPDSVKARDLLQHNPLHQQESLGIQTHEPLKHEDKKSKREADHEEGHHEEGHHEEPKKEDAKDAHTHALHAAAPAVEAHKKSKREADHEEGHHEEGHHEEPKKDEAKDNHAHADAHKQLKREAHHEEGHHEEGHHEEPKKDALPHALPASAHTAEAPKQKRNSPPKPEASKSEHRESHHREEQHSAKPDSHAHHKQRREAPSKPASETAHEGLQHDPKKAEELHKAIEALAAGHSKDAQRHQRDIPVPTEIKSSSAPANNKATTELAIPIHHPVSVAELFHKEKPAAAAGSSSEESKEKSKEAEA